MCLVLSGYDVKIINNAVDENENDNFCVGVSEALSTSDGTLD